MAEKPINMVNLGGLNFNSNLAKNYGEMVDPENLGEKKFFINFKDGTRVEYAKQNNISWNIPDLIKGKNKPEAEISKPVDHGALYVENAHDIEVTLPNEGATLFSGYNKNITINGGNGKDYIDSWSDKNVTIKGNLGDDSINLEFPDNVDVDGGAGADQVNVFGDNENGKIHLDNSDKLRISKLDKKDKDIDFEELKETNKTKTKETWEETKVDKSVEIQGEGVHNLKDTKFSDVHTVVTEKTIVSHLEDNPNYDPEKESYVNGNDPELLIIEVSEKIIKDEHTTEY